MSDEPLARVAGGSAFAFLNSFLQASGFTTPWLARPFLLVASLLTISGVWGALKRKPRAWRLIASVAIIASSLVLDQAQETKRALDSKLEAREQALLPILEMTPDRSESKVREFLDRMPWKQSLVAGHLPDMIWAVKLNMRSLPWSITISRPKDAPLYLTFAARVHWPQLIKSPVEMRRRVRFKALAELARLKVLHEIDESDTLKLHVKVTYRISNMDEAQIIETINLLRSAVELVGYSIDSEGVPGVDWNQAGAPQ